MIWLAWMNEAKYAFWTLAGGLVLLGYAIGKIGG